ncbi:hypothetical protein L3X38_024982 [Prunus dulcis]|uniref:Uncharacterized protein n=1 Tax=Prunus dulcis TaxID=3755 RepID=A0AAD4W2F5_PRUDU|nr:hypothetical protein L3X38_024982 [Prunus dulcis]
MEGSGLLFYLLHEHGTTVIPTDDLDSPPCYPEIEEIPEPEELSFFQWLSPPSSPLRWESPPFSPLALPLEVVEFVLREGND